MIDRKLKFKMFGLLLVLSICQLAHAQNSYSVLITNTSNETSSDFVEYQPDKFAVVGSSNPYGRTKASYKAKIWLVGSGSDTSSISYSFGDTAAYFNNICKNPDGTVSVGGNMFLPPEYEKSVMFFVELDSLFQIRNQKIIAFDNWNEVPLFIMLPISNNGLFGVALAYSEDSTRLCLIRLDSDLNLVRTKFFIQNISSGCNISDMVFSTDSSQLWVFAESLLSTGQDFTIIDTSFNLVSYKDIPHYWNASTMEAQVYYGEITAKLITDSTFLIGGKIAKSNMNYPPTGDQSMGVSELDTTMVWTPATIIGSPDTTDYPAWSNSIDLINPDSIYFAGTYNMAGSFYPQTKSWVMTGMLNRNLEQQFIHYYGGDAFYHASVMRCTSDGGVFIVSRKYDYLSIENQDDIFILKLNNKGLITNMKPDASLPKESLVIVSPNPFIEEFTIDMLAISARMVLSDLSGRTVLSKKLKKGRNRINASYLKPGVYFAKFQFDTGEIGIEKIIKK
ncbi:MAG: T9SS type A sorting domain-containing protein [Bacteroidales bacterium]